MKMPGLILFALAALLPVESASPPPTKEQKEQIEKSAQKVKELRKERIAVLKKLNDELKGALVDYDEVLEAERLLIEAELEVAETDTERVELYKKLVEVLRRDEVAAINKQVAVRGTEAQVMKAKARRLEGEILLQQAWMKAAKSGIVLPPPAPLPPPMRFPTPPPNVRPRQPFVPPPLPMPK